MLESRLGKQPEWFKKMDAKESSRSPIWRKARKFLTGSERPRATITVDGKEAENRITIRPISRVKLKESNDKQADIVNRVELELVWKDILSKIHSHVGPGRITKATHARTAWAKIGHQTSLNQHLRKGPQLFESEVVDLLREANIPFLVLEKGGHYILLLGFDEKTGNPIVVDFAQKSSQNQLANIGERVLEIKRGAPIRVVNNLSDGYKLLDYGNHQQVSGKINFISKVKGQMLGVDPIDQIGYQKRAIRGGGSSEEKEQYNVPSLS